MAQSHYPSSAELAAFRQHVSPITFSVVGIGTFHPPSGAWPHERQHGIGDHTDSIDVAHGMRPRGIRARREASRERSATYAASGADPFAPVHLRELREGIPDSLDLHRRYA